MRVPIVAYPAPLRLKRDGVSQQIATYEYLMGGRGVQGSLVRTILVTKGGEGGLGTFGIGTSYHIYNYTRRYWLVFIIYNEMNQLQGNLKSGKSTLGILLVTFLQVNEF